MQAYGFNDYQHDGDLQSSAREGHVYDGRIAAEVIHWLDEWRNFPDEESVTPPFFMVASFVNPHDVMTVDIDGTGDVKSQPEGALMKIMSPPEHVIYQRDHQPELCASWHHDYNSETRGPRSGTRTTRARATASSSPTPRSAPLTPTSPWT